MVEKNTYFPYLKTSAGMNLRRAECFRHQNGDSDDGISVSHFGQFVHRLIVIDISGDGGQVLTTLSVNGK